MITGVKKVQLDLDMGNNKERARQQMMAQMEDSLDRREETRFAEGQLSARVLGRLEEHADQYSMPRSRLPKMDQTNMDRYAAARRNVLLLGALAETSKKKTGRPKAAQDSSTPVAPSDAVSQADDSAAGTEDLGQALPATNFTSFKSHVTEGGASTTASNTSNPGRRPFGRSDSRMSRVAMSEAGQSDTVGGSDAASVREYHRSASINASEVNSTVAPSMATRRMRPQISRLSMQSHTRTDRSGVTMTSGRTTGRRKKGPPKPRVGRITLAFQRWGSQEDWVSKVLLRHALASIIQARWRGYILRKRMAEDRTTALEIEHARLNAEELRQQRLAELRQQVEDYKRKQTARQEEAEHNAAAAAAAAAVAAAAYEASQSGEACASGGLAGGAAGATLCASGGSSSSVLGLTCAAATTMRTPNFTSSYTYGGSDSDSGWSDVELEQVTAIKFRARTPPWQAVEEGQAQGRQRRLVAGRPGGGAMDTWQAAQAGQTGERLEELRHRRILRPPLAVTLSQPASAAAEASGILPCDPSDYASIVHGPGAAQLEDADALDSSSSPLSVDVIDGIMENVVRAKMQRLGLPAGMQMPHFRRKR